MSESLVITKNQRAFLDLIAYSEIGPALLAVSDNGYNVIVGSTPQAPDLFTSYADHPRKSVWCTDSHGGRFRSSAAGRYQILCRYFDSYALLLHLPDFSPMSQDAIALQLIKECHALNDIENGDIGIAITRCCSRWASLPGAGYSQHENKMGDLLAVFNSSMRNQA